MGSFWDDSCYIQYHNGRPLSVALTEPFGPDITSSTENDIRLIHHSRSPSSGRQYKREYYSTSISKTTRLNE